MRMHVLHEGGWWRGLVLRFQAPVGWLPRFDSHRRLKHTTTNNHTLTTPSCTILLLTRLNGRGRGKIYDANPFSSYHLPLSGLGNPHGTSSVCGAGEGIRRYHSPSYTIAQASHAYARPETAIHATELTHPGGLATRGMRWRAGATSLPRRKRDAKLKRAALCDTYLT